MEDEKIKSDIRPVIIVGVIFFFMLRPQEGYLQRLDFLIFLFENGLLLENIFVFEVFSLLVLFPIFILLYIFRNPLGRAINRYMHYQIARDLIEEFDKDEVGELDDPNTYYLNHSKHRVKSGLSYSIGSFNFGLSHKYDSGFNANLGVYSGVVTQRNVYDTNLGLQINPKTYLNIAVYNIFGGESYSTFPGMPMMGMSGMATLRLDL